MATLAELLRQGADTIVNLPSEAQRFITNPQAFTQLLTGKNPLPKESGFAAGATGLPAKNPVEGGVLNPEASPYMEGYETGEPFTYASALLPFGKPAAKALGPKAYDMLENYMVQSGGMANIVPPNKSLANALRSTKIGENFDPRFDPRALEQEKLKNMVTHVEQYQANPAPKVRLDQFEGRPFITSMSDRTAAGGYLLGVDDVQFKRPIDLMGGQDYMFNNPNQVWASAQNAVNPIIKNAQVLKEVTGQNPLYIPWRMAPTGGDFAHMTGETMLGYAESAMGKAEKKALNNTIKSMIPDWKGVDSPESIQQFRSAPDKVRKAIKNEMDVNFRDQGGMSIGQARLAVADPRQLNAPEGGIMNVGEIYAGQPMIMNSGHPSYPRGVAGQGLGTLETENNIFQLLPNVVRERGIANPLKPSAQDIRALQMKPYAGMIDDKLLKSLGY